MLGLYPLKGKGGTVGDENANTLKRISFTQVCFK